MEDVLIVFIVFGAIVKIIQIVSENRTRRILIQQNEGNADLLKLFEGDQPHKRENFFIWGLLLIFLGITLLVGYFLQLPENTIFGLIFLFAGITLLIQHFLNKRASEEETDPSSSAH
ncbi:MAG: hypothetical protein D6748_06160 [Calditrichaeota bacterium]|nr:MAG: hypothetical protein D6748_06160 [Calditrichota bacterium]